MKKIIYAILLLSVSFFTPRKSFSQQPPAYQVPDTYTFDYDVTQQMKEDQKKSGTPKLINYSYTTSGDYMGIRPSSDKNQFIIFTKDGLNIIIDDEKKTIIVLRLGNLIGDIAKLGAQQGKNSTMPSKTDSISSNKSQFAKTGNSKQISGYKAEEYSYTNNKGESGTVWCAKVDFNTALFYTMATVTGGSSAGRRPSMGGFAQSQSYPSFNDPHLLIAETTSSRHPGEGLVTQSITKKTTTINTKGYTINNMSNMGLKELMEMKSKQP
jgi:hypothetical protein